MKYNPEIHHRKSLRLKGYDYSKAGAYFITICCEQKIHRFGKITSIQNEIGQPDYQGQPQGIQGQLQGIAPSISERAGFISAPTNFNPPKMKLNEFGQIAYNEWIKLSERFKNFELDVFQIMPNHMHGIIVLNDLCLDITPQSEGQSLAVAPPVTTIGDIIGAYKSLVANECLKIYKSRNEIMGKLWQRNYHERIIFDEKSYKNISEYILNNPLRWQKDKFYTK